MKPFLVKTAFFFFLIVFTACAQKPKYVSVAFIKSKSVDFIAHEKTFWVVVQNELLKEGRKDAWYMYHVKRANGELAAYDYVRFSVFHEWKQLENPYSNLQKFIERAYPGKNVSASLAKTNDTRDIFLEQLFEVHESEGGFFLNPSSEVVVQYANSPFSDNYLKAFMPRGEGLDYQFIEIFRSEKYEEIERVKQSELRTEAWELVLKAGG